MKKMYKTPAMQVEEVLAASMLAESLIIGTTTVDGGQALVKEYDWDIFGEYSADINEE